MAVKTNFSDFSTIIKNKSDALIKEVQNIGGIAINDMELMAIRLAPGPGDLIITQFEDETQESIRGNRNWSAINLNIASKEETTDKGFKWTLQLNDGAGLLGAWIEFGTGQDATQYLSTVPEEWKAEAQKYYINGKGTILSQPYILPSYMKYKEVFLKELKEAVKNFGK